jgi:hypothetical protein
VILFPRLEIPYNISKPLAFGEHAVCITNTSIHSFGELVDRLQLSLLPFYLTKLRLIIYIRKYLNGLPFWLSAVLIYSTQMLEVTSIFLPLPYSSSVSILPCFAFVKPDRSKEKKRCVSLSTSSSTKDLWHAANPSVGAQAARIGQQGQDDIHRRAGMGAGTPSYNKKHMHTFDKGTPQEWMESLTSLRKIWQQNSVNGAHDRAATVAALLKGNSRIAFKAAIEDAWTDPNAAALIPLMADHVKESLCAVTTIVFPFCALETQKQWMNKYMKKLYNLSAKMMSTVLSRINNYLPSFLDGDANSKFTDAELVGLLDFSLPASWRKRQWT